MAIASEIDWDNLPVIGSDTSVGGTGEIDWDNLPVVDDAPAQPAAHSPRMTREERIAANNRAIETARSQEDPGFLSAAGDALAEGAKGAARAVKSIGSGIVGMASGAVRLAGTPVRLATGWEGLHRLADTIDSSYENFGADALMSDYGENPDGFGFAAGRFGEKLAGTAGSLAALGGVGKAVGAAGTALKMAGHAKTATAVANTLPLMFGNDAAVRAYDTARANGKSKGESAALAGLNGAIHFLGFKMFENQSLKKMLNIGPEVEVMMPKWADEAAEVGGQSFSSLARGVRNGMVKYIAAENGKRALKAGGIMGLQNFLSDPVMQVAEGTSIDDIDFSRMLKAGAEGVGEGALMEGALGAAAVLKSPSEARKFIADKYFRGKDYKVMGSDGKMHDEPGLLNTSEGRMVLMKQNPDATERVLDIVEHGGTPRPAELDAAFLPPDMTAEELKKFASDWRNDLKPYVDEAWAADAPRQTAAPDATSAEPGRDMLSPEEAQSQQKAANDAAERQKLADRRAAADSMMLDFESWNRLYADGKTDLNFDEWRAAGKPGVIEANLTPKTEEAPTSETRANEEPAQPEQAEVVAPPAGAEARPVESAEARAEAADARVVAQSAVWPNGWDDAGEEIKGYVVPNDGDVAPGREVAIAHRSGGSINAPQKIKGVVESVDGDKVKVYYRDGMGYDQHDTFKKSELVGVMPLTAVPTEGATSQTAWNRAGAAQKGAGAQGGAAAGEDTPAPAKPVETPSRASDAKENVADRIRRLNKDVETAQFWHPDSVEEQIAFIKRNVPEALEATSYEELLRIRDNYARKNYNPDKAARMERKAGVVSKEQHVMTALNTILEYGFPEESAAFNSKPFVEQLKTRGFNVAERDGRLVVEGDTYQVRDALKKNGFKWDADKKEWYTEAPAKVPDGKGKMVKPKAAESDYGVTMFEEPAVDGDGVRYVVKDGPSDAHRMMFKSKAEAEARLGELRAERKAIQESPSATLSDGKKVRLLKTDEGWVPYDENYNDLRHGMFKAAKTKAEAVKVAEKGVKWARGVAEENARFKAESAKSKPDGKGKMVKPEPKSAEGAGGELPSATVAPVVENRGDAATVVAPESVEAKIAAMKRGSPEQLKAQREYVEREVAKAKDAIKGKFRPKAGRLSPREKAVDAYERVKNTGDIPETVNIKVPGDGEITVKNNPNGMAFLDRFAAKFRPHPTSGESAMALPRSPSIKVADKPKAESAEKEFAPFVSKDKTRERILKPYTEGKMVVATDGRVAVRRPLRKGESVKGADDAPRASQVFGRAEDAATESAAIDVQAIFPKLQQALVLEGSVFMESYEPETGKPTGLNPRATSHAVELWRDADGALQVRSRDTDGNSYASDAWSGDSAPVAAFDGKVLVEIVRLAAKNGEGKIEVRFAKDAQDNPVLFKFGGYEAALMPLRAKGHFDEARRVDSESARANPAESAEGAKSASRMSDAVVEIDATTRESAKRVRLSAEAIADIKDWIAKNPNGNFTHNGFQKIFDAEMERVKTANGGVNPKVVLPTLDAISVAYHDMKSVKPVESASRASDAKTNRLRRADGTDPLAEKPTPKTLQKAVDKISSAIANRIGTSAITPEEADGIVRGIVESPETKHNRYRDFFNPLENDAKWHESLGLDTGSAKNIRDAFNRVKTDADLKKWFPRVDSAVKKAKDGKLSRADAVPLFGKISEGLEKAERMGLSEAANRLREAAEVIRPVAETVEQGDVNKFNYSMKGEKLNNRLGGTDKRGGKTVSLDTKNGTVDVRADGKGSTLGGNRHLIIDGVKGDELTVTMKDAAGKTLATRKMNRAQWSALSQGAVATDGDPANPQKGDLIRMSRNGESPAERDLRFASDENYQKWLKSRKANDAEPLRERYEQEQAKAAKSIARNTLPGVDVEVVDRAFNPETDGGVGKRKSIGGIFTGSTADYANRSRQGGMDDGPSLMKIGTGEGTQVYGWGLYGSTERGVAEGYADNYDSDEIEYLGEQPPPKIASWAEKNLKAHHGDIDATIQELSTELFPPFKEAAQWLKDNKGSIRYTRKDTPHLYEQTFFTDRAPGDESHLLKWYEPSGNIKEQLGWIREQAKREGFLDEPDKYGNTLSQFLNTAEKTLIGRNGQDIYSAIEGRLGSPKAASEFFARAGIDGVKYPVDSYGGKPVKDGDEAGWNYVSFRDDNIRVDHKWEDGQMRYLRDSEGRVVGTFDRSTNKVTLYRGATAATLVHELGGHATLRFAEQEAERGNRQLLDRINRAIDEAPQALKDEIRSRYPGADETALRDEIWAALRERNSPAMEKAIKTLQGKAWYNRAWSAFRDAWKGLLARMGFNRADLSQIDKMSNDEFLSHLDRLMSDGKTLGRLEAIGEGTRNAVRKGVSAAEDAAYMDAVKRGDMEAAQRMVNEAFDAFEGYRDADGVYHYRDFVRAVGYRLGDLPSGGRSYNVRDNIYEDGVSLAGVGNLPSTQSFAVSGLKDNDANVIYIKGDILTRTGGDDEFLMRNARVISKDEYEKALSSDGQKIAEKTLADKKWDLLGRIGADRKSVEKWANIANGIVLEAVVKDDVGNVIPLSQRFNPKSENIREARSPRPAGSRIMDDQQTKGEKFTEEFIDSLAPVKSVLDELGGVKEITRADGYTDHTKSTDLVAAKDKANGRLEHEVRQHQFRVDDINRDLARAALPKQSTEDLVDDFNLYLQCKHAPERNLSVAQDRGDAYTPDYSEGMGQITLPGGNRIGLSENVADRLLRGMRGKYGLKFKMFENAADKVYKMLEADLDRRFDAGRLSAEDYAFYKTRWHGPGGADGKWAHYIPLKTDIERLEPEALNSSTAGMKRNEFMKARGRGTGDIADSPLAAAVLQTEQGIRGSIRNEVANVEANLVEHAQKQGIPIAEIVPGDEIRRGRTYSFTFADGETVDASGSMRLVENHPEIHLFKRDGKLYAIRYDKGANGRGLAFARAASGENMGRWGQGTEWIPRMTHLMSAMRTQYSPEFTVSNWLADHLEAAQALVGRYGLKEGGKAFAKTVASEIQNWKDLRAYLKDGTANGYIKEFVEGGGLTKGGVASEGFDAETQKIRSKIEQFRRKQKQWREMSLADLAKSLGRNVTDFLSFANELAEYSTRTGLYTALRKQGVPQSEAIKFARDATVNFNRKGTAMPYINGLYMFANASVQGAVRSVQAMRDTHGKELIAALTAIGVAKAVIDNYLGNDDEREAAGGRNARNQSEYDKKHNVGVPIGGGRQIVPLRFRGPYAAVPYLAQTAANVAMGATSPEDGAKTLFRELGDQVTDLVGGNGIMNDKGELDGSLIGQSIAPSVADPIVQLATGKDYKGEERRQKSFDKTMPASSNGKRSTASGYKWLAKGVNAIPFLSGGNEFRKGRLDFSPEDYKLVLEFLLGAPMRDFNNVVSSVDNAVQLASGGTPEHTLSQIPFVRRVVREYPESTSRYYDALEDYERDKAEFKKTTPERRREMKSEKPYLFTGKSLLDGQIERIKELTHLERGEVKVGQKWVEPKTPRTEEQKEKYRKLRLEMQARVLKRLGE